MASLNVRDLDDEVKRKLRLRAADHGRSMEAEVRSILADAVAEPEVEGERRLLRLVIVLDTNVVSELIGPQHHPEVADWVDRQLVERTAALQTLPSARPSLRP